jgi:hypothetical protein
METWPVASQVDYACLGVPETVIISTVYNESILLFLSNWTP